MEEVSVIWLAVIYAVSILVWATGAIKEMNPQVSRGSAVGLAAIIIFISPALVLLAAIIVIFDWGKRV